MMPRMITVSRPDGQPKPPKRPPGTSGTPVDHANLRALSRGERVLTSAAVLLACLFVWAGEHLPVREPLRFNNRKFDERQ
jgi:hypothetical protein